MHLSLTCNKPMNIFGPVWDGYWEKICADWQKKVTNDDIVLISGDISWAMKLEDAICDIKEIDKLPGKKVFIRGNHDYWWKSLTAIRTNFPADCYAIQNDSLKLGNFVICGTRGWTVPETTHKTPDDEKIYNREAIRLELSLQAAKKLQTNNETIICMMHYPPFNSKLEDNKYTQLLEKYEIPIVVYGHLHSYDKKQKLVVNKNGIKYYLTSCDLVNNQLIKIL